MPGLLALDSRVNNRGVFEHAMVVSSYSYG